MFRGDYPLTKPKNKGDLLASRSKNHSNEAVSRVIQKKWTLRIGQPSGSVSILYLINFKMEAMGVTPMPAAHSKTVLNLNTSSEAAPNGPSTWRMGAPLGAEVTPRCTRPSCLFGLNKLCSAPVQSPAFLMCTPKKSSSGLEEIVNGCHSWLAMYGQLRKTYWPGLKSENKLTCQGVKSMSDLLTT